MWKRTVLKVITKNLQLVQSWRGPLGHVVTVDTSPS
jgi:hypothetical protein